MSGQGSTGKVQFACLGLFRDYSKVVDKNSINKKMKYNPTLVKLPDVQRENYRLFYMINYMCYLGVAAHALFVPLFFYLGVIPLAILNAISVIVWGVGYFKNRSGDHRAAIIIIAVEVIVHASVATYFLGWDSGFHYYLLPLVLFVCLNHRQSISVIIFENILLFALYMSLYEYTHTAVFDISVEPIIIGGLGYMNIAVNFTALAVLGYYFRVASVFAEAEMERLATTDPLTKLYNRRKMRESLERERIRFARDQKPFIIAIADIDHFKKFNDTYGHDCGDYVLQEVSHLMKECLRKQDIVARWGGEEFLIMLPETELEGGVQAIDKLRETLAETKYKFEENEFSVTMTFGVTVFDGSQHIDGCIKAADEVLYAGKRGGRNRVVST